MLPIYTKPLGFNQSSKTPNKSYYRVNYNLFNFRY